MKLLSEEEGQTGLTLAKVIVDAVVSGKQYNQPPLPAIFSEKRGVFVTLNKNGALRGCIGIPLPVMSLADALYEAAASAARSDPRFPPVKEHELSRISLELTVLSVPEEIQTPPSERYKEVIVGRHGLIVQGMGRSGLLLPQVATDHAWEPGEFLDQTCIKAGLTPGCWQREEITVLKFEGQIFRE